MSAVRNVFLGASSFPPATRYITLALVASSCVSLFLRAGISPDWKKAGFGLSGEFDAVSSTLLLYPALVLYQPWTLLTSAFIETSVIELIVTAVTLALAGRYLERMWNYREFLKFVAVCIIVPNIITVAVALIEHFVIDSSGLFIYGHPYHGMMALQTGFLVAFTQLIPEHHVQFFGGLAKLKVKQLPMLYVGLSNVMCVFGMQSPFILIQFGWFVSWWYLRFVKDGGDRSETFAFANWFPPFVRRYVARAANTAFDVMIRIKLLKPWTDIETGSASPSNARAEAERRRAMALQALDQRLASSKPAQPTPLSTVQSASSSTAPTPLQRSQSATSPIVSTNHSSGLSISTTARDGLADSKKDGEVVFDADRD